MEEFAGISTLQTLTFRSVNPVLQPHLPFVRFVRLDRSQRQPLHAPPRFLQWHTWLHFGCATKAVLSHAKNLAQWLGARPNVCKAAQCRFGAERSAVSFHSCAEAIGVTGHDRP